MQFFKTKFIKKFVTIVMTIVCALATIQWVLIFILGDHMLEPLITVLIMDIVWFLVYRFYVSKLGKEK
jgi:hypothetical protein